MFEAPVQEASAFPDMCPFDVHVKQQTVSTIELEWRPIPDTRVYKVLDLSSSKAVPDAAPLATYWGPATQCRITGLDSNRCYTFGVQAMQCEPTGGYTVLLSSEPVKVNTKAPPPSIQSLHRAIRSGHEYLLKRYLTARPQLLDVPIPNSGLLLPLCAAVLTGRKDLVDVMLRCGADVNAVCPLNRRNALQLALFHGHVAIAKCLAERRADRLLVDCVGLCAAHYAIIGGSQPALRYMSELYADVLNGCGSGGDALSWTQLLLYAVRMRCSDVIVGVLLEECVAVKNGLRCDVVAVAELAANTGQIAIANMLENFRKQ